MALSRITAQLTRKREPTSKSIFLSWRMPASQKRDIAATLGAMFATENSIAIKFSILNELYYLQDPSVLEQVTVGLSPNQPLEVRDEAISVLQDIGDKRAIPFLWPLLADPDDNIREDARDAIDSLGK